MSSDSPSTAKRAQHDDTISRRKVGGAGREFSGGNELLRQFGEALGLVFPTGFQFPPSGRFQGGFGGGFEYTWGAAEETPVSKKAEDEQQMDDLVDGEENKVEQMKTT